MNFNLREPNPGDKISANLIREIIRAIRSLTPIKGPGMKISRGPNGTVYASDQTSRKTTSSLLPWTFICTVENAGEANETRKGGWTNCRMQIGYDASYKEEIGSGFYGEESELNEDGIYYAEVDLIENTWELKAIIPQGWDSQDLEDATAEGAREHIPPHDFENNKVNVFIGIVSNAECIYSIHCIPVVYKYV